MNLIDSRQSIPDKYKKLAVALTNFRYTDFKNAWFNTTIASFSSNDPKGLVGLKDWLDQVGSNFHTDLASTVLSDNSVHNTPISMLQSTLLRVWVLKRIALNYGTIEKPTFVNAGEDVEWHKKFGRYLLNGLQFN